MFYFKEKDVLWLNIVIYIWNISIGKSKGREMWLSYRFRLIWVNNEIEVMWVIE